MKILTTAACLFVASNVMANFPELDAEGSVTNAAGDKCAYTQSTLDENTHFFGEQTAKNGVIEFTEGSCMPAETANLEVLYKLVASFYKEDAGSFQTAVNELSPGGVYQQKGQCIRPSEGGPNGIVVDHVVEAGSIIKVVHGIALDDCNDDMLMMEIALDAEGEEAVKAKE